MKTVLQISAALLLAFPLAAAAGKTTVCTVTVNSADEREAFRRHLPEDRYEFVELVERGRPDWLASSCRRKVSCDVLVVSGHFAGTEFYSSKPQNNETLPVDEIERVACSDSCPDLFSNLKEVYLFGCDTLKPEAVRSATPEIVRGLVRDGKARADAEHFARALSERQGENARDRMRRVFPGVPVIYGFASLAPYGRTAGPMLDGYFRASTPDEVVGSGVLSPRLVRLFAPSSMVATNGLQPTDPNADYRAQACRYYDDRSTPADRRRLMEEALGDSMVGVRMSFDRVEKMVATAGEVALAPAPRENYLAVTRATEDPALRIRMIALARKVGWLTPPEQTAELERMIRDVLADNAIGFNEVELICGLNKDRELDGTLRRVGSMKTGTRPAHDAALACLGSDSGRARILRSVSSADESEVRVAQAYRPITDDAELHAVTQGIVQMKGSGAQVRALETLARHRVSDRRILDELSGLFAKTKSPGVQSAIAEIFIRSGVRTATMPKLSGVLRQHRIRSAGGGQDLVDVLLQRLQES
jgi:hypothetical protein